MSEPIVDSRPSSSTGSGRFRALTGWVAANAARLVAGAALAAVAAAAGTISYTHIDALTLALGGSQMAGHLMPVGVDGQMVVGSVVLMTASGATARWGWLGIGLGMIESLFANYEAGISHGPLAAGWYAVPALSFAVATFTLERWAKAQISQSQPCEPGGQPEPENVSDGNDEADPDPCTHRVGSSAEESLVEAFLHSRDCTGEPLSQRKLSASFGVARPRVAELVGPHLVNGSAPDA